MEHPPCQLLEVAMGNECAGLLSDEGWASPYFKYRVSAWVLVFVYPLGIPLGVGWQLFKQRDAIKKGNGPSEFEMLYKVRVMRFRLACTFYSNT